MRKNELRLVLALTLTAATYWACSNDGFNIFAIGKGGENAPTTEETISTGTPDVGGENPDGSTTRLRNTWVQPVGAKYPLDILFVSDSSGSLDESGTSLTEREATTAALQSFITSLESSGKITDWCIGVMLGHFGERTGKLYETSGDPCLCKGEANITAKFAQNFEGPPSENLSDGGEAGLYSLYQAFNDGVKLDAIHDAGCFRQGSALAVIFFADENDISTSGNRTCVPHSSFNEGSSSVAYTFTPVGPASVVDSDCAEYPARKRFHSNADGSLSLGYTEVYNKIIERQAPYPFTAAVIGYTGTVPAQGENEKPYGYLEFVQEKAKGDLVDLGLATSGDFTSFNNAFASLGEAVAQKASTITVFDLSQKACSKEAISITVAGAAVTEFSFDGNKRVTINDPNLAGKPGESVVIEFDACP